MRSFKTSFGSGPLRLLAFSGLLGACLSAPPEEPGGGLSDLPAGCQPLLGGHDCMLPYPSDFFLVPDESLPSGFRVELSGAAKLLASTGSADIHEFRPSDGFSRMPTIVAFLPGPLSARGLVGVLSSPEESQLRTSPTLLIEARTGTLLPHFVDLDPRADDPERQGIIIHPLVALKEKTRYIVALHGLTRPDGTPAEAPLGFALLRDGQAEDEPVLAPLIERYEEEIFPVLEAVGVPRDSLQLAWDFTTGSEAFVTSDMLRVRELTLAELSQNPPTVTIDSVEEPNDENIFRIVKGTVTGPLFLTEASPEGALFRDGSGQVAQNGNITFAFTAMIPVSVQNQTEPGRVVGFGHGFFGGQGEVESQKMRIIANRLSAVLFAIDWFGMTTQDGLLTGSRIVQEPSRTLFFAEGVHQGMANWLTMGAAIRGVLLEEEAFLRPQGGPAEGQPLYQTEPMSFLGISQGHILGGTLAALSPDFSRFCLNVGGAGFTHMMFRARPFDPFLRLLEGSLSDPLDQQKFTASLQEQFDRFDPSTYAPFVLQNPLPQSPPDRRVLLQIGLGDRSVPNLGSFLHARLLGIPELSPNPFPVFGLGTVEAPFSGSALALYDFGIDLVDAYAVADPGGEDNEVHESVRLLEAALAQMDAFFQTDSVIINACQGICDPE